MALTIEIILTGSGANKHGMSTNFIKAANFVVIAQNGNA